MRARHDHWRVDCGPSCDGSLFTHVGVAAAPMRGSVSFGLMVAHSRALALMAIVLVASTGCGKSATSADGGDQQCDSLKNVTPSSGQHLSSCSDTACGNGEDPPTGGDHCSSITTCRSHTTEQPRCQWLHNMEHGHVVLLHNCPSGCADDIAKLEALRGEAKKASNGVARALMTPDSRISKRFAAVIWGWSWSGDAVDEAAVRCLLTKQDQGAPEPGLGCAP